jgi:hypothetical protein
MSSAQVLYHGNCFDGVVSAAIFTRFILDRVDRAATVSYRSLGHGPGDPYGPDHAAVFCAELNAVVDFRYSPSPALHWWCDHHQTTFLRPEDAQHLAADTSGQRCFDPTAPSCAGLLCRWLAVAHGLDARPFADHVQWADIVDAARFASPTQAVELREPALQLMTLLEAAPGEAQVERLIRDLAGDTIEAVWRHDELQRALSPVLAEHRRTIEIFRARLQVRRGVAYFDLVDDGVQGFNKFIPYHLDPALRYTVALTSSPRRTKVSVGSNPWRRPQPLVNLGELCQRYRGGGHAVVGAVTLPVEELDAARSAALEIVELLRAS